MGIQGERRHLTVMFCDLVDSTALSERLDPEDLCRVIEAYQDACTSAVERYEGHVAQYLGDGMLIYFSYPVAHEDDAARAARAGLDMLSGLRAINPRLLREYGVRLSVRIGLHTGPVVLGTMGDGHHRETLALGRAVNVAARLPGVAPADAVVMSGDTLRLVRGLFETRELGTHDLRGIRGGVSVHQVERASGTGTRLEAAGAAGLTPLVGRD